MRVLFMGTPDFAAQSLKALAGAGYEIVGVVTQPDKPKGRGHKMMMPETKTEALALALPVYQPVSLRHGELKPVLEETKPDVIVVVAYGKILPDYVLEYSRYGCINVHGSLLPKYRGAAPIQWAVVNGEKETGVTTMKMDAGIDTGDVLLMEKTPIGPEETAAELFDRLAKLGGSLLVKTLQGLEEGTLSPIPQDHSAHTYARIIKKEDAKIDWTRTGEEIVNLVRGMNSWPMAYTQYQGTPVKIIRAAPGEADAKGKPGELLELVKKKGLRVACGAGSIYVRDVQFAGSKRMNIEDYMRGHALEMGLCFE